MKLLHLIQRKRRVRSIFWLFFRYSIYWHTSNGFIECLQLLTNDLIIIKLQAYGFDSYLYSYLSSWIQRVIDLAVREWFWQMFEQDSPKILFLLLSYLTFLLNISLYLLKKTTSAILEMHILHENLIQTVVSSKQIRSWYFDCPKPLLKLA